MLQGCASLQYFCYNSSKGPSAQALGHYYPSARHRVKHYTTLFAFQTNRRPIAPFEPTQHRLNGEWKTKHKHHTLCPLLFLLPKLGIVYNWCQPTFNSLLTPATLLLQVKFRGISPSKQSQSSFIFKHLRTLIFRDSARYRVSLLWFINKPDTSSSLQQAMSLQQWQPWHARGNFYSAHFLQCNLGISLTRLQKKSCITATYTALEHNTGHCTLQAEVHNGFLPCAEHYSIYRDSTTMARQERNTLCALHAVHVLRYNGSGEDFPWQQWERQVQQDTTSRQRWQIPSDHSCRTAEKRCCKT